MKTYLSDGLVGKMLKTSLTGLGLPEPRNSSCVIFLVGVYEVYIPSLTENIDDMKH